MQTDNHKTATDKATPLISFIITCYNLPGSMLRECLTSVLKLSLKPSEREIIVVDDGSDSPVEQNISAFADDVNIIRQNNAGPGAARNAGLEIARGEYIQFIDGDDCLLSTEYEHCLSMLRQFRPDMVLFGFSNNGQFSMLLCDRGPVTGADFILHNNICAAVWRYVFKRDLLHGLRFTSGINNHEDEEFTPLLMLRAQTLYTSTAEAYFYRLRKGSLTNSTDRAKVDRQLSDFRTALSRLQKVLPTLPEAHQKPLRRRIDQLAMDYLVTNLRLRPDKASMAGAMSYLVSLGLYPLPKHCYTFKYSLFRHLVGHRLGRMLLRRLL